MPIPLIIYLIWKFNRLVYLTEIMYKSNIGLHLVNCDLLFETVMSNWNLFKLLKKRRNFAKRPKISNPILICPNIERNFGELAKNKQIIEAKSEKNLANLEEIKATLLQWKEENDKIFTDHTIEYPKKVRSELTHSLTFDSSSAINLWSNRYRVTSTINESDSSDSEERGDNFLQVIDKRPVRNDNFKRPERTNSFKALGKALIKEEDKDQETDFF